MIAYASYTSNRRSLAAVRAAGWRVLLSPATSLNNYGVPYALDNGAWSAFKNGSPFDEPAFQDAVHKIGPGAAWVVAPDIVEGGAESLDMSLRWLGWLMDRVPRVLIAVQDGMSPRDVQGRLGIRIGLFVGGSTEWKEETMPMWGALARSCNAICHVGRVNSARRIALCVAAGVDSFDGSSVSRFANTLPRMDNAARQRDLLVRL